VKGGEYRALFLYSIVSLVIIFAAIKWADKYGKSSLMAGSIAAVVMYGFVFWDLIPVYAVHAYQCKANSGFTVYKSIDEWKQENPGVAEILFSLENSKSSRQGNTTRYMLNQRFSWDITREKFWHIIKKIDERIIDTTTNEIIAREIDFNAQVLGLNKGGSFSEFKFWFYKDTCFKAEDRYTKWLVDDDSFYTLYLKYKHIQGDEK